jgi:hypothetical protein
MEKAGDIIKDALGEITVLGEEAPVEPADSQSAIRYLNRMMAAWNADGIDLGYTVITSFGDDVTIPDGAIEAVIPNLAVRLHAQFEGADQLSQDLLARAVAGKRTLLNIAVTINASEFPSTLPIGSGNEGDTVRTDHFYPDLQAEILAETTGPVGLEESTT